MADHVLIRDSLKLLQVFPFIAKLAILETIAAVPAIFALPRVLIEWHQTTFTLCTGLCG